MMRSLWTAASGMISQQTNVDTISNNLANINTTGYKKENAQFKTLLYQTIQTKSTDSNGEDKPSGIQVGLGVRNSAILSQYTQGNLNETGNDFDFGIQGNGFFRVQTSDGSIGYTRNGAFGLSVGANGITLATTEGYPILDTTGAPIVLDSNINTADLQIDESGNLLYPDENDKLQPMGIQISLAQFNNPAGLEKTSDSILKETAASGTARLENEDANLKKSVIKTGFLEGSNVQAVNEMVDLIVAQRAYEMNSKSITAADEMLQQANNLRR
ncbi:flagellar basal-body rod protein FlgG [Anaerocolumna sedimenticola]|uniref:Flagellar basal-body rod protein FlgG n=1 Tax=Anaerocolumna sedimenticola TaxID=2696063 RepID=A0A6P1TFQ6_9FIRM|nr:flagellar basal-body rod protein FlgG [Anaerocolumna sedimenticola]QHQ60020.1 flagellar basal-body rod protein FlgG [Anaerocolumna sedimenticola]